LRGRCSITTTTACDVDADCPSTPTTEKCNPWICGSVCDLTNQTECDALDGLFLARPQRTPIPLCAGDPCEHGSCCVGPGVCKDYTVLNERMTKALCDDEPGTFVGGIRCGGGTCAGGGNEGHSCRGDSFPQDCPGSDCIGDAEDFAQVNPCPICEHSAGATCDFAGTTSRYVWLSDTSSVANPTRQCNDIKPTVTRVLEDICLQGVYLETIGPGVNCSATNGGVTDAFTVRLYAPDPTRYFPGAVLGKWATNHSTNRPNGHTLNGTPCDMRTPSGAFCYADFQLTLIPTPHYPLVQLQTGEIYFVEVSNNTTGGELDCDFWMLDSMSGQGNGYAFLDTCGTTYTEDSVKLYTDILAMQDPAWCLNVPFEAPPSPVRACCTGDPLNPCFEGTIRECAAAPGGAGDWQFDQATCPGFVCPVAANDLCGRAPFVHEGAFEFNLFGANRDGSASETCLDVPPRTQPTAMGGDIWYRYQPSAPGTAYIGTCDCERGGDEVVAIYTTNPPSSVCPCPDEDGFTLLSCHDGPQDSYLFPDGCQFADAGEEVQQVTAGICYLVRVATFGTGVGVRGTLRIALAVAECGNNDAENVRVCRGGSSPGIACTSDTTCGTGGKCVFSAGEQCDGTDDSLCPGECAYDCLCPPPVCGLQCVGGIRAGLACVATVDCPGGTACAGKWDSALGEECDGTVPTGDLFCPTLCRGPTDTDGRCSFSNTIHCPATVCPAGETCVFTGPCTCIPSCGNGRRESGELCDGDDDAACLGALCTDQCKCVADCGNGDLEIGEDCDTDADHGGASPKDANCPTGCLVGCTCPPPSCGNGIHDVGAGEECETNADCGAGAPCRPPGDPAGECTCACPTAGQPPGVIVWDASETSPLRVPRSITVSMIPPATASGSSDPNAIRVTLVDLQNVVPPYVLPAVPPNFGSYESATCNVPNVNEQGGCARWVGKPGIFLEFQDFPLGVNYKAARLQCSPYYTDWVAETKGGAIAIVGAEILPSSQYSVRAYHESCAGKEYDVPDCPGAGPAVLITTRRSGDVTAPYQNPLGPLSQPDGLDVGLLVAKFKGALSPSKGVLQLQPNLPELNGDINALDILAGVDAFRGKAYSFDGPCPCPSLVTCGGSCTTGCSGMCVKTCVGGANAGDPCVTDLHCPGSTCSATGSCRDKCGRCK